MCGFFPYFLSHYKMLEPLLQRQSHLAPMKHENVFSTILTEVILGWYFNLEKASKGQTIQNLSVWDRCRVLFSVFS